MEEVSDTLNLVNRHLSMDSPVMDTEEYTLTDIVENANADRTDIALEHYESLRKEIARSLSTLTQRQKEVLCYFFGIGMDHALSLEDIGARFHLTRERVRQIKDKAIIKLQNTSRCKQLKVYLG